MYGKRKNKCIGKLARSESNSDASDTRTVNTVKLSTLVLVLESDGRLYLIDGAEKNIASRLGRADGGSQQHGDRGCPDDRSYRPLCAMSIQIRAKTGPSTSDDRSYTSSGTANIV